MLVYILVVLILLLIFLWLFMKVFALPEPKEQVNVINGERCILISHGNNDQCTVSRGHNRGGDRTLL